MIKFQELKVGDIVLAEFEGRNEGEVTDLNREDKEVCVKPCRSFGIPPIIYFRFRWMKTSS